MHKLSDQVKYRFSLFVQDIESGITYDIGQSGMIEQVMWDTSRLLSQPGTLEVLIAEGLRDTGMTINPGSFVRFGVNGTDYFYGRVQEIELVNSGEDGAMFRLIAYDSLILLKAAENMYRPEGMSATAFFMEMMTRFSDRGLSGVVREDASTPLPAYYFVNASLYSMLKDNMTDVHVAEAPYSQYMVRDSLGTLEWRELRALQTPYILGDESFAESYTYAVTINGETYNVIKAIRDNEELGTRDVWQVYDGDNVARWGHKQLVITADEELSDAEIRDRALLHLEAFNRPRRELTMLCHGVNGLQAGDGVRVRAGRARIDSMHWCESVSHTYTSDAHMMDLTLYL